MPTFSLRLTASLALLIAAGGALAQGMESCIQEGLADQIAPGLDPGGHKRAGVRTQCQAAKVSNQKAFEVKYGRDEPVRTVPRPAQPGDAQKPSKPSTEKPVDQKPAVEKPTPEKPERKGGGKGGGTGDGGGKSSGGDGGGKKAGGTGGSCGGGGGGKGGANTRCAGMGT